MVTTAADVQHSTYIVPEVYSCSSVATAYPLNAPSDSKLLLGISTPNRLKYSSCVSSAEGSAAEQQEHWRVALCHSHHGDVVLLHDSMPGPAPGPALHENHRNPFAVAVAAEMMPLVHCPVRLSTAQVGPGHKPNALQSYLVCRMVLLPWLLLPLLVGGLTY